MTALDTLRLNLRRIGQPLAEHAFLLYHALRDPAVPVWAKAKATAALAYFVSPVDAIPDMVPLAGYADDLGVLAAAAGSTYLFASHEMRRRAREDAARLFGASVEGHA